MDERQTALRKLPKIDELLKRDELRDVSPRWALVEALRREVERLREAILTGDSIVVEVDLGAVKTATESLCRPSLRRVINATGVVLHTNLGRAPMPAAAIERIVELASGYTNLEYDVDAGKRGSRHGHLVELLRGLTGAEDAAVVNNNAGAVMLALAAAAHGREVIVSRGELIEIGGSFRIPDVMRLSGARLVEVGTTNKTRLADYESAITDDTALLLKVHRSNFEIVGFSEEASLSELVELGRKANVGVMNDLGSGALLSPQQMQDLGLHAEPGVKEAAASGCDIVTFSGDKLLGGPQAGVIVGRAAAVDAARKHPLMRALRPDKLTIAALEATLGLFRDHRLDDVPAIAMLGQSLERLRERALALMSRLSVAEGLQISVVPCESTVGGGAMPSVELPSWGLSLAGRSAEDLDRGLRAADPPVVGRIAEDQLILDLRTVHRGADEDAVASAIESLGEPA